jgi:hypothetical protein
MEKIYTSLIKLLKPIESYFIIEHLLNISAAVIGFFNNLPPLAYASIIVGLACIFSFYAIVRGKQIEDLTVENKNLKTENLLLSSQAQNHLQEKLNNVMQDLEAAKKEAKRLKRQLNGSFNGESSAKSSIRNKPHQGAK